MSDIEKKVLKYEAYLNDKLRADLRRLQEERDTIEEDIAEHQQTKEMIEKVLLDGEKKSFRTKMDLGEGFFCQAVVPSTERIMIKIGLGFHVEMTLPEAKAFLDKQISYLKLRSKEVSERVAGVSALIRLVMQALEELQ
eukprot:m.25391 g.25391  ORF g.25391 m.25391 type:complete len:139 (+) comp5762_c0_seq1:134-550(+)